jgi:hypothetical protein
VEYIFNKLTLLYSEIHYKERNYLKVRTTVFKYITPPIVKVKYISMSVHSVRKYISTRVRSVRIWLRDSATPCLMVLLALLVPPLIY